MYLKLEVGLTINIIVKYGHGSVLDELFNAAPFCSIQTGPARFFPHLLFNSKWSGPPPSFLFITKAQLPPPFLSLKGSGPIKRFPLKIFKSGPQN